MSARPASGLLVSAMIRRIEAGGGHGAVLAKGDAASGAILLAVTERGETICFIERALSPDGAYAWARTGPADLSEPGAVSDYVARRRRGDPDLWVVELDSPDAERVAAEVMAASA